MAVPEPTPPAAPAPRGSGVTLPPHYGVAAAVLLLGLGALALAPLGRPFLVASLLVCLLGLFLLLQTSLLRLEFQEEALVVWRQDTLLRCFPYAAWLGWKLFWPALPVVFYFREERSIHLLPLLFNAAVLREQLTRHLSDLSPADA